ncbi:IS3 family transposase [Peribacillus frigoritolerans]|uniref:IS3 family transposase n=1 Tax=Peribacillus frigoritolerans TaxID=450367 RepID=UPI0025A10A8E|nr:IS3 family transposase [Peribacillus frigoritolerans]MDM5310679.1 IS3 family transposase [Peribacillus frigoritolerans]
MANFSAEQKIFITRLYLEGKHSYMDLQKIFEVSYQMIQGWVRLYQIQGADGFKKSYTSYSTEFKMDVLNYMNETGISSYDAAARFNISSPALIRTWRINVNAYGLDALISKKKGRPSMKKDINPSKQIEGSVKELEERIKQLEMENAYLKKLNNFSSNAGKITTKIKAQVIYELKSIYEVVALIKVADIPRSTYYYWEKRLNREDKYSKVKATIQSIYHEHKGRYGYRRITKELKKYGFSHNPKTINRLMNEMGVKCLVRMKKYRSYKGHVGRIAPHILQRDFQAEKMNQKWVTDVTEFHLFGEKRYLSPILDLCNGEIIAYKVMKRPVYKLVGDMLDEAIKHLKPEDTVILHSDQGWHYQMKMYQKTLKDSRIIQSMSRKGNCLDNAVMENFFGLLKSELLYLQEFESMEHFEKKLDDYIHYYNHKRMKVKLKDLSPIEYRTQVLEAA